MSELQKLTFCNSLYWPSSRYFCPCCSFFSSSCRCFSTCFLACLASSIFSMPILTRIRTRRPRRTARHRRPSRVWLAFSSCSKPRGYFPDTRSSSPHSRTIVGRIVPLAFELRVGGIDLLHPLLRILPDLQLQVGHLVRVVGLRELPVCSADLLCPCSLRHPKSPSRRCEPG